MCLDTIVRRDPATGSKYIPASARVDPLTLPFHHLPAPNQSSASTVKVTLFHLGVLGSFRQAWADDVWDENLERRFAKAARKVSLPVLSALIEHEETGEKWLWDLGMANDSAALPKVFTDGGIGFLDPVLNDHGQLHNILLKRSGAASIEELKLAGIILSHAHVDHYGNMLKFPTSLPVFVGPGTMDWVGGGEEAAARGEKGLKSFPSSFLKGGRRFIEVQNVKTSTGETDIEGKLKQRVTEAKVGAFETAWDWFGDGSVYLCQAKGHCYGHMVLLARTTASPKPTYVLLSGDAAHHQALYHPIPPPLTQDGETLTGTSEKPSKGAQQSASYSEESDKRAVPGYFSASSSKAITSEPIPDDKVSCMQDHPDEAMRTQAALSRMDALEDVMVVLAHEDEFVEAAGFKEGEELVINQWKEKGLKEAKLEVGRKRRAELARLP